MIRRVNLGGNPNLGVSIAATENVAIVPATIQPKIVGLIEECLEVQVIKTAISGSNLAGALVCGNSNGFVVSKYAFDREIETIRSMGLKVEKIPDKFTAVGNIILANDQGALVSPLLSDESEELISQVLDVEVKRGSIAKFKITGSVAAATNKGALVHPSASQEDLKMVEEVLKIPADVGTVNNGTYLIGSCVVANSKGVMVSLNTTGPELARIEETFGFLEGYL
jgi:translation initiation factor 6